MAIMKCPNCKKSISDKSKVCPHCDTVLGDLAPEDLARKQALAKFQTLQKIQTQSIIAILIFLLGCYLIFGGDFEDSEQGLLMYNLSVAVAVIGFIWYCVNRVRIIFVKRK